MVVYTHEEFMEKIKKKEKPKEKIEVKKKMEVKKLHKKTR